MILSRLRFLLEQKTGFDRMQWSRIRMYEQLFRHLREWEPGRLSALEISPGSPDSPWRQLAFAHYRGVEYPDFDICRDALDEQFDVIIADQVFEHLLWPYRAARTCSRHAATGRALRGDDALPDPIPSDSGGLLSLD